MICAEKPGKINCYQYTCTTHCVYITAAANGLAPAGPGSPATPYDIYKSLKILVETGRRVARPAVAAPQA